LGLRLEITQDDGASNGFIITQENGITALRSIGLAEMCFKCGGAIVGLGRKPGSAEFVKKYEPKPCAFLSERRNVIETIVS
jgi:hypothetical protein